MGYTHYWSIKSDKKNKAADLEKRYQRAIKQCQKIAYIYNQQFTSGDERRLSGYTAHCKPGSYGGLKINGRGANAHEDFCLPEHYNEIKGDFCKTAQKSYDSVVVACLIVLKHYLPETFQVESDGRSCDWFEGLELAQTITKLKSLRVPSSIEPRLKIVC